jgi:hypothetical protein
MISAFKKNINQPWHKVSPLKRIYANRGKYARFWKIPKQPIWMIK